MYVFVPCSCALCSFLGGSWSEPGSDPGASPQYRGPGKVEVNLSGKSCFLLLSDVLVSLAAFLTVTWLSWQPS